MELQEEKVQEVMVLAPKGRLDSATSPLLGGRLEVLAAVPQARLILDLSWVDFVSSAGLRVILAAAKQLRSASGRLVVCSVQPPVQEVLDISGFTALLTIRAGREDALGELAS
ncbi:MAG TPA: STAS domain-containing protein [Eoetvoesiella sp.]|uniref:STAS domain-containing protein n=1 Tax=Eoetvoesiella sp. TaxID=1966355 RepID=UPI002BDAF87D|nr:STAS domain-containing protein [Eoetvoesiella sp.]HWK61743.1 STAS domain-containing protein [Eoetvoesiella sp.]